MWSWPFHTVTDSGSCEYLFKILVNEQEWIEDSVRKYLPFIRGHIFEDVERAREFVKQIVTERRRNTNRNSYHKFIFKIVHIECYIKMNSFVYFCMYEEEEEEESPMQLKKRARQHSKIYFILICAWKICLLLILVLKKFAEDEVSRSAWFYVYFIVTGAWNCYFYMHPQFNHTKVLWFYNIRYRR